MNAEDQLKEWMQASVKTPSDGFTERVMQRSLEAKRLRAEAAAVWRQRLRWFYVVLGLFVMSFFMMSVRLPSVLEELRLHLKGIPLGLRIGAVFFVLLALAAIRNIKQHAQAEWDAR